MYTCKRWMIGTAGLLALALLFGGAAHAAQATAPKTTAAAKKPAVREIATSGVIASADATHLTMTRKVNGKDETINLVLTPETKREGDLAPGNRVSVRYHMENNQMVASQVRAQTTAAKAAPAKAKTSSAPAKKS